MLLKLEISNFCSFRDNAEFSLIPSREKLHRKQHIYTTEGRAKTDVLRLAVIYGANASGKSNLIKAIDFAKWFITQGVQPNRPIPIKTFKLDEKHRNQPVRFYFEILIEKKKYSYEFILTKNAVLFEELNELLTSSKRNLFRRELTNKENTNFQFGTAINKLSKEKQQFYKFTAEGTRTNKLFLSESVERNATKFQKIYDWFNDSLRIFSPVSVAHGLEFRIGDDKEFTKFLKNILSELDPNVVGIKSEYVDVTPNSDIPERMLNDIERDLAEEEAIFISNPITGNRTVILKINGELKLLKIFTQHKCIDTGEKITFDLEEESDGTRRTIELSPLLYELMTTDNCSVAFIDELDRSLHPMLTKRLIELFLNSDRSKQSQMILSTHDTDLLDTSLLRQDMIWFIPKNDGASSLSSLKEFNQRYDKDIRKEYLQGSFGGIPIFDK